MTASLAILYGCAVRPERLPICPGRPTAAEALRALAAHAQRAVPLRATGEGLLTYHVPDKKGPERHNVPLQMWFNPPTEIYIRGSVAVDPQAIVMGSNEREFWLALRPQEMSSYYRGEWGQVREFEGLMVSPRLVLEALGLIVEPDGEPNAALWSLANEGPYDVLTRRDATGRPVRRLHIYACDYLVHKIEYFDRQGKVVAAATLGDYEPVEGFPVPTEIDVASTRPDGRKDSIAIELGSMKVMKFNERQRQRLFVPPDPDRFKRVYRYEDGRWVPE